MRASRQLVLDLGHLAAFEREDFIVGPCNADAVAWIDRWPRWEGPGLVVHGPAGCGKSHLAHVWKEITGARIVSAEAVGRENPCTLVGKGIVLEDADRGFDEEAMLHLFNMQREEGGHLMITAKSPPARWLLSLADLRSRLVAVPTVRIAEPDDVVLAAVMVKLFSDRQLKVGDEVVSYLVNRIERAFSSVYNIVDAIDRGALAERRNITVPLVRRILDSVVTPPSQ